MLDGREQLGVETGQASQLLSVDPVGLAALGVDELQFAGVGDQDLVSTFLEQTARPRRVGARLDGDAHRSLRTKAPPEGFGGGANPALLDHLAALGVQQAQVAVAIPEIDAGNHRGLSTVSILHMGRSSSHDEPFGARKLLQTLASGYCVEGRPSHPILTQKTCARRSSRPKNEGYPPSKSLAPSAWASPPACATPRWPGKEDRCTQREEPGQTPEGRRTRKKALLEAGTCGSETCRSTLCERCE